MPPNQGIPPQQPSVFPSQPNFPNQNFVSPQQQQQGILRPVGGATVQPMYRNVEPLVSQRPPNQPQFLLPNPPPVQHSPQQTVIYQQLLTPLADRLPFDGNVVRTPMSLSSSLPGYVDFGGGEGNQLRFGADFCSDPEIVGQPIETVIHNRKGQERIGDGRARVGFGQNNAKDFAGGVK